jgi:CRISPR-associated protein Cas2
MAGTDRLNRASARDVVDEQPMSQETRRFMRLLVFFDLPVVSKADRRAYTLFRRFLLNDGYDMLQFSVYGRILNGTDAEKKHMQRLVDNLPEAGSIRVLTVTEKQFASMKILVGMPLFQEKKVNAAQMLLF